MVDTMITLQESTETLFTTNGLGALSDAISCEVTEERNGEFELEMEYPITGTRYEELQLRRIIMAKANPYSDPQPFRIYAITKPINGIVTVNAEHISYDMSGYPVSPFVADTIQNAFINMKSASAVDCPFSFSSDKTTTATMTVLKPSSMRSLLGGVDGSILDVYGGEYEFDRYNVKLWNKRGSDRGVSIRYGKNLTDLKQEENCSSVYTGVYPFWYSEQDGLMQLDEKIVKASGTYNFTRIYPLDLSQEWTEKPTQEQLKSKANTYIKANDIGVPAVSLTVSFVQLSQSTEYAQYALLEDVHLCDTVKVEFPELNVSATAKCVKTTYDAISNKYVSIELGESRTNLATTISGQSQAISDSLTKTFMQQAIENATQLISGGLGGYVIMHSSTGGKYPDEILIMDTDDIATAKKVWRWNKGGLGYSSTGYNGPFALAMTQDGQIVADFVTTGTMSANRINGGTLILGGTNNSNGTALIKDSSGNTLITLDKNGMTLSEDVYISYENISDTPTIPSKTSQLTNDSSYTTMSAVENKGYQTQTQVTKITKDTVTTSYVNALKVTAGSVAAENITGTTISGKTISGGTIAIGDNFAVDSKGNLTAKAITATNIYSEGNATFKTDDTKNGGIYTNGNIYAEKNITANGNLTANGTGYVKGNLTADGNGYFYANLTNEGSFYCYGYPVFGSVSKERPHMMEFDTINGYLRPTYDGVHPDKFVNLGSSSYRFLELYSYYSSISMSDRNAKKNIEDIGDKELELFKKLKPVSYMMKKEGSDRTHYGFISQDVEQAMADIGFSDLDFAGFCKDEVTEAKYDEDGNCIGYEPVLDENGNPEYRYSLRYSEFIALNTMAIQKLMERVAVLENKRDGGD